ncbi:MAG: CsiV family protein [Porticoccaceae bacterium]
MSSLLLIGNSINAEQITKQTDPAAENWYQVEVILFDQKTITGTEEAPEILDLSFPANWLELGTEYPAIGIMRRPVFDRSSTASINNPKNTDLSRNLSVLLGTERFRSKHYNDGSTLIPEATIPYQTTGNENIVKDAQLQTNESEFNEESKVVQAFTETAQIDFKPVYEQPFQKLSREFRDLNDTARGLDRRQYKVRFHEAWRFQITSKEKSPWIMVNTETSLFNRQIIEGSLRFYKSRYLHFESDLWRINFSPSDSMAIKLPEFPKQALNNEEEILLRALQFSKQFSSLTSFVNSNSEDLGHEPESLLEALGGYDLSSLIPILDSTKYSPIHPTEKADLNSLPIKEIWPIRQSKRIQEDEVYYIDHPHMGALISIKPHQPIAINLPPEKDQIEEVLEEALQ